MISCYTKSHAELELFEDSFSRWYHSQCQKGYGTSCLHHMHFPLKALAHITKATAIPGTTKPASSPDVKTRNSVAVNL